MLQVLGASLGFTMGCSGEMRENQMRKDLTGDFCQGEGTAPYLPDLQPSEPVDAMALRTWTTDEVVVNEVSGSCDTIAACPDEPPGGPSNGLNLGGPHYDNYEAQHLVAYRGEEASIYSTEVELRAFLGTIDSPGEARLLIELGGYRIPCDGDDNFKSEGEDYVFYTETGSGCGEGNHVRGHLVRVSPEGHVEEEKSVIVERAMKGCVVGRLPDGLCMDARSPCASEMAEYMARASYLEAASVAAFEDLEQELRALGAPDELVTWAARAAREEQRHAIYCRALTRHLGGEAAVPCIERGLKRTPLEIALENAREGLTREAFGALIAEHQAQKAEHPGVRRIMQDIARDELSHAEFSVALHAYLMSVLDATERAQVEAERQAAVLAFASGFFQDESPALREQLGLPARETCQHLFQQFFARADIFQA